MLPTLYRLSKRIGDLLHLSFSVAQFNPLNDPSSAYMRPEEWVYRAMFSNSLKCLNSESGFSWNTPNWPYLNQVGVVKFPSESSRAPLSIFFGESEMRTSSLATSGKFLV